MFLSIPFVCGKMNKKYFYFRGITFYFTYTTVDHTNFIYLTTKDMFGLLLKFAVLKCGSGFTGCPSRAMHRRFARIPFRCVACLVWVTSPGPTQSQLASGGAEPRVASCTSTTHGHGTPTCSSRLPSYINPSSPSSSA